MEKKGQNVIKIYLLISLIFFQGIGFAQENSTIDLVFEEPLSVIIKKNINSIFSVNPLGNIDSVKFEGYYAILKVKKGKVIEIFYPQFIDKKITRRRSDAIININQDIDSGKLVLSGINQIVIPAIREWIHFKTSNPNLDEALKNIMPKTGYTPKTYLMNPIILYTGNPRR